MQICQQPTLGPVQVRLDIVASANFQNPASVPADEYLSAFVLNFNNAFSISSAHRETEFYSQPA